MFLLSPLLFLCQASFAEPTLILDGKQNLIDLAEYIEIYEDLENLLSIEEISKPEFRELFIPMHIDEIHKGFSKSTFWIRLHLKNDTPYLTKRIIKSKHSIFSYFNLYIPVDFGVKYKEILSGFLLPYSKRQSPNKKLIFAIEVGPNQEQVLFLKINSLSSININMQLLSEDKFNELETKQNYFLGGFYSILFSLLIANIVINFLFKKRVHLYLLAFLLSLLILFLIVDDFASSWFEGNSEQTTMGFIIIFSSIALYSIICFARSFAFEIYQNKFIIATHYLLVTSMILTSVTQLTFGYNAAVTFYIFSGTVTPLFIFCIAFISWITKRHTSTIYLLGVFFLLLGISIQTLFRLGMMENFEYVDQSARMGILLFLIFMSLTVIDFVNWLQLKEKDTLSALSKSKISQISSEEKFTKSFYHLPVPMQIINYKDLTRVAINNSFSKLIGYSIEEIKNKKIFNNGITSDPETVKEQLKELIDKGSILKVPLTLNHSNGQKVYTEASAVTLEIENQSLALISFNDITELRKREEALQEIAMGVSANQNGDFFSNLILQLSKVFDANYAFLGLINKENPKSIDTYSFCIDEIISDNFSYDLTNTPCENVIKKDMCTYPKDVSSLFPKDELLIELGIESYIGAPLKDSAGETFGIMVVMKKSPMVNVGSNKQILKIFASRAASEFENYFSESQLINAQQKLELHVEQTPLAVIEWNVDFEVAAWNPAAEKIFGYSASDALGKKAKDLIIPKEFLPHVDQIWKELLIQQGGTRSSNENITKQGKVIYCEWYNTPLVTADGEVIGVASLAADITTEHNSKIDLIHQEHQQRAILSSMIDGVLTMDEDGTILSCNPSALRISGYSEEDIVGANIASLAPKSVSNQFSSNQEFSSYLFEKHNAETIGPEVVGVRKDQTEFPMRLSIVKLINPDADTLLYIGSFQDLTQIKSQEEQLRRSQKMDALGKLTGGIAHDFNNLLGVIIGYSDLLDKTIEDNSKQSRYSMQIHKAAERGAELTKKLLGFSRTKRTETTIVNINDTLTSQIHLLEKTLTARIKLNFELDKKLWTTNIDEGDFEDAILNLCINSMHAIEGTGQITIKTCNKTVNHSDANIMQIDAGEYVLVQITDSGCGIDKNVIERIFDPFFSTKGEDGTGLGLSQVYGFVKNSQGAIKVYSELGHGTQFNLYFVNFDTQQEVIETNENDKPLDFSGTETILVLDDEEPIRLMSEEILLQNGYKVHTAESAKDALKILKSQKIDLVLSDVIMPKMDGYQFAKIVQKDFPKVKIQLASGFTDDRQNNIKQELYYKLLLQKPYSAETLLKTIRVRLDNDEES